MNISLPSTFFKKEKHAGMNPAYLNSFNLKQHPDGISPFKY